MIAREISSHSQPAEARHLYAVGQMVGLAPHVGFNLRESAVYEILATLPDRGGSLQYRVKSPDEPHDRMVSEHEILEIRSEAS